MFKLSQSPGSFRESLETGRKCLGGFLRLKRSDDFNAGVVARAVGVKD
jgi:hypothetical protein